MLISNPSFHSRTPQLIHELPRQRSPPASLSATNPAGPSSLLCMLYGMRIIKKSRNELAKGLACVVYVSIKRVYYCINMKPCLFIYKYKSVYYFVLRLCLLCVCVLCWCVCLYYGLCLGLCYVLCILCVLVLCYVCCVWMCACIYICVCVFSCAAYKFQKKVLCIFLCCVGSVCINLGACVYIYCVCGFICVQVKEKY